MNEAGGRLRVVTWNIHGCIGRDGRRDRARIAGHLAALRPDVAALQEVDSRHDQDVGVDTFDYLRGWVGDHGLRAPTLDTASGQYGHMLVSRWPLTDAIVHDVSFGGREPRKIIDARIEPGGAPMRVMATHLGLNGRERGDQLSQLRAIVDAGDRTLPTVVLGDFNDWRRRGRTHRTLSDVVHGGTDHATFPSVLPLLPLDRILWHPAALLVRSWIVRDGRHASDHLALAADLAIE